MMLKRPLIRRFFAGSHTAYGYYSLYDNILNYRGRMFIIFKGGPGTGKSTILKKVGESYRLKAMTWNTFIVPLIQTL